MLSTNHQSPQSKMATLSTLSTNHKPEFKILSQPTTLTTCVCFEPPGGTEKIEKLASAHLLTNCSISTSNLIVVLDNPGKSCQYKHIATNNNIIMMKWVKCIQAHVF